MKKLKKNAQKKSHEVQDGFDSGANQAVNNDKIESASFENFSILQSEDFEAQKNVKIQRISVIFCPDTSQMEGLSTKIQNIEHTGSSTIEHFDSTILEEKFRKICKEADKTNAKHPIEFVEIAKIKKKSEEKNSSKISFTGDPSVDWFKHLTLA